MYPSQSPCIFLNPIVTLSIPFYPSQSPCIPLNPLISLSILLYPYLSPCILLNLLVSLSILLYPSQYPYIPLNPLVFLKIPLPQNLVLWKRLNAEMPQKPVLGNFRFFWGNPSKLENVEGFPNIFEAFPNI